VAVVLTFTRTTSDEPFEIMFSSRTQLISLAKTVGKDYAVMNACMRRKGILNEYFVYASNDLDEAKIAARNMAVGPSCFV
jgi:hypothetical protein